MAIYFRAADRREVAASEALDARGVLKSGYGTRVPYAMRDAAPRFAWDAHRDRDSLLVTDGRRIGGVEGCRPGYRIFDADVGRAAKEAAYAEVDAYRRDAWRNPPRDAGFGALDKKIKKYNAKGQETGYFEETEEDDAASVSDAGKKKEDPPVTGRSRCPECDGRGVVHGRYCQGCGGDGWVDDDEKLRRPIMAGGSGSGELEQLANASSDRRMLDVEAVSAAHQQKMAEIYAAIASSVSSAWKAKG